MQTQLKIQKVKIEDLFYFPETNSKITKKFCNQNKGEIPVYASSKDEKSTLGFIQNNLRNIKYYENCLSWNRNGSVGYVFIRNHKFTTNEDHRTLMIKEEYKDKLDKLYLKFEIERQLFINGFSFLNKCGVEKISSVEILLPIKNNGDFDLEKQKEIAQKYLEIRKMKEELNFFFENFEKIKVNFNDRYKTKSISITGEGGIFEAEKGNPKYTKKYMHDHTGEFPVYSSQTSKLGEIGSIDTYDYEEECFTWTTDGTYVGTVFYRNGKFSITTHCGILRVKPQYRDKVDFEYLNFILNQTLPNYKLGEGSNKRLGTERMKEVQIEIPIDENGDFDVTKQREIAGKHKKIEEIKAKLKDNYEKMINSKVQIIEVEE